MRIRVLLYAVVLLAMAAASPTAFCTTVTWDAGGLNELWSTPANWSTDSVPNSTDDVIIAKAGSGEIRVDVDPIVNSVTVKNGATLWVEPDQVLKVNTGTVDIGGQLYTFGSTLCGALTVNGAVIVLNDGSLIGSGALTVNSGLLVVVGGTVGGSGALIINSGGFMDVYATPDASVISLTTTNAGTIHYRAYGPGSIDFTFNGATLTNTGIIEFQTDHDIDPGPVSPILNNSSGGVIRKSLGIDIAAINFPVNNAAGATIYAQSGTIALNGGGDVSGDYLTLPGATLALTGGTFSLTGSPTFSGTFSIAGATLDADAGVDVTWPNVFFSAGTITGAGDVRVSGNFTWSGGTIAGSGARVLKSTSVPTISCSANCLLDGAALQLQASTTFSASSAVLSNGASLILDPGKTLSITNDGDFIDGVGAAGSIINNGTIWKKTTSGTSTIGVPVTLSGTGAVDIATGTLQFGGGASVAAGATLDIDAGGALEVTDGVFLFNSGTVSMPGSGTFKVSAGTLRVPTSITMTIPKVTLQGSGVIDGGGTLILSGTSNWAGGTMGSATAPGGITRINSGNTLNITNAVTLRNRTLQNHGTLSVGGNVLGSGTIDNQGTLNPVGNITIGAALNNNGQIATSVALSLTGGGTHTGSFSVTTPGNLSFSSGTHSVSGGGSIGGTGTLTFNGATATVDVPVNVGTLSVSAETATLNANGSADAFTMTGGTLGGSGILTLNNGGTWSGGTWFGGTTPGSGTTVNPATKTLSIPAPVTLNSRTLQNDGTLSVSGNVLGSGTIDNQGTLNPVGNITIGAALNNSGQIAISDLFSLGGNGAHSGTFTTTATGVIDFSGGTQTVSGTLAGTGRFRFSGAAATVNGTWTGMPIEVAGGSVALNTNGMIPALTLSGGTLAGSGNVTVSGPSTWSGGMLAGSGDFTFDTGATVTMPGTNPVTLARPLLNRGTINFTAASNGMLIAGARFRNNGTFDIQSSQEIAATPGTPSFVNAGTLKKSSDPGVMQFGAPLSNSGQVRIETGTIQFGENYAQSAGRTTILSGATLHTATLTLNGGSLTGNGTVVGTVSNDATVSPGASPGTLTVNGNYVQSSDGVLNIQIDGTAPGTQYDRLLVSGSVTLGGTLDVTTSNGFTPTPGNAFQIITFGSRAGDSTFDVMNGLTGSGTELGPPLVPTFSAADLKLIASPIVVPPVADVAVAVTGPASTIAGAKVIYTITVSNKGQVPATDVAVAVTASGLTFSGNGGACVGSFPCTIGTLSSEQSVTIYTAWDIPPSATGSVELKVDATSAADADASNNSASATTNIGTCPATIITAPSEMTTGLTARATVTSFGGATYRWSILNGTIVKDDGPAGIDFTAGEPDTTRLSVDVTGGGCTSAALDVTVKPTCVGTATLTAPADGATADGRVEFSWNEVDGASGYDLWLEQDDPEPDPASALYLGRTLGTPLTTIIPPGAFRWYVETLFDGCGPHRSARRSLTIPAAQDCASRGAPELSAPVHETQATSAAVAFSWKAVDQALEYKLVIAPEGGVPTPITTSETSYTALVPPRSSEWYVQAVFAGCVAATESAHRAFTYTPPSHCTRELPLQIAPLDKERLTSPVSFEWTSVTGATSYELYIDGVPTKTTTSPGVSGLAVPEGARRWQVRAHLGEGCGPVDSGERGLVVIPPSQSCAPLGSPLISAPAQLSSGVAGRIQWSFVAGATAYEVEISTDRQFPRESTSTTTVTTRQLPFKATNEGSESLAYYVRVHAVDTNCVRLAMGPFSPVAVVFVLSATSRTGAVLLTEPACVPYTLDVAAKHAGESFTATPTVPWIKVTPASGIVPPEGQKLGVLACSPGLVLGTNTGGVAIIIEADPTGEPAQVASFPLNNIPGVVEAPKSTPPPDALFIPAVAHVTLNSIVRYGSDIRVANTSAQVMKYDLNFVPTGPGGPSNGNKTQDIPLDDGVTMAIDDVLIPWFAGRTSTGTLEIRPMTDTGTSTSNAPVCGLENRTTFASSLTFTMTAGGGKYGQYIPAVPYANFVGMGTTLSLQHIAQSEKYRTNLGLVEGSGQEVSLQVRIFDAAGTERASLPVNLNGGECRQLNLGVLLPLPLVIDDGRIEVKVTSGNGKVTAYASVVDNNATNDGRFVPPATLDHVKHRKWIVPVPCVADLIGGSGNGSGNWQTDVRIFNAGKEPVSLTLDSYSMNGRLATTSTIEVVAGKVWPLNNVPSCSGIPGDAGVVLHVSSEGEVQIVVTARTYKQTDHGTYGQFMVAITPEEAVAGCSRPLQILQMEQSPDFNSSIGFAEVSGKPVTLKVTVFLPNSNDVAETDVPLQAYEYKQLPLSFLKSDIYNARISVRAIGGDGRALAYGSLIDRKTGDPTYIPGQ